MSNLLEVAAKEILRKEILQLCFSAAPNGCSMDVLRAAFTHKAEDTAELERQADYLQQKGLVSISDVGNKTLNLSMKIVKITAAGIDLLEGNAEQVKGIGV
ncbi:MAG: hypothetical protein HFI48_05790 [Lachnospiraceae bacterium]|nr:hypothetical protein [Lachnospiraceae bacterium]